MRIATYNVENLFSRVSAMNSADPAKTTVVLEDVAKLQRLIEQPLYSEADKKQMLAILRKHRATGSSGPFFLQETRRRLYSNGKIVAEGRGDWVGSIEWRRDLITHPPPGTLGGQHALQRRRHVDARESQPDPRVEDRDAARLQHRLHLLRPQRRPRGHQHGSRAGGVGGGLGAAEERRQAAVIAVRGDGCAGGEEVERRADVREAGDLVRRRRVVASVGPANRVPAVQAKACSVCMTRIPLGVTCLKKSGAQQLVTPPRSLTVTRMQL